jgi:TetR/AcrR family transcriptional regulator, transcriptional repressor for nem operon
MRITKQQAAENRHRVVAAAARLFRERGFDGVGVADLMGAAGLTHGGFYNHFGSKDELGAAACAHALTQSVAAIEAVADAKPGRKEASLADYRRRYLSRKSRDATGFRCPMVAFGADVSRQSAALQERYAEGLRRYLDGFVRALGAELGEGRPDQDVRAQAIAQFSTMVGAVLLARGVAAADPALSDEILAAGLASLERGAAAEAAGAQATVSAPIGGASSPPTSPS